MTQHSGISSIPHLFAKRPFWLGGPANEMKSQRQSGGEEQERPFPRELFNLEQLIRHAGTVARGHRLTGHRGSYRLLPRLGDNERVLIDSYEKISEALAAKQRISPAGEWLLDNFHLIEEQIRIAKRHLPRGYSRKLPHLASGPSAGLPRVYDIALEIIAHVDGRIDQENITSFVSAYQDVEPLSLGELWAIPIMLRLALIENLRRVSARVAVGLEHRALAQGWADRLLTTAEQDLKNLIIVVADMARAAPPLTNSFIAELAQRLQEKGAVMEIPLTWIEQQLAESSSSVQQRVQQESQQQAGNQVSVGSSVGSLRFLNGTDWRVFVEAMSVVDKHLCADPAGVYSRMDFATRDRYRHMVEALSRTDGQEHEARIAQLVTSLAADAVTREGKGSLAGHVGYYLIDEGRATLEQHLRRGFWGFGLGLKGAKRAWSISYFAVMALVTASLTWWLCVRSELSGGLLALVAILGAVTTSQVGVALSNWMATALKRPVVLPRLDFAKGVPASYTTMVIVPTMLINHEQAERLVEGLEVRFLGNRDPNLMFGLLTDFTDAPTATLPSDDGLLEVVREGIKALNAKYDEGDGGPFYLLHRARAWNPAEGVWMGYERKRGKLEALNDLLRGRTCREGQAECSFATVIGAQERLRQVKYVITLDTDTQLPRDAAYKLIGTMAHPLNNPRLDAEGRRVVGGYGLLQPRVAVNLPSSRRSWFVRLFAGDAGTDPYTLAVSDVYQDLFGEGSFVGKGIYDVDTFSQVLGEALPENLILSHDLIEGCFVRSGLVSDVLLYEDHPSHYIDDVKRRRRWTRGDWQIAAWLLPKVPHRRGKWVSNPLSFLARWKIFDNLRRSLAPVATLVLLLTGWLTFAQPWVASGAIALIFLLPAMVTSLIDLMRKPRYARLGLHLQFEVRSIGIRICQALLGVMFLPNDAFNSVDAFARSWTRMLFTRKKLLEWHSANDPRHSSGNDFHHFFIMLSQGPVLAAAILAYLVVTKSPSASAALGFVALWAFSPGMARWLSQTRQDSVGTLNESQVTFLRRVARRTWRFFEVFVCPDDHWLPPDNFQEFPAPVVAHRTSPTNMGMAILANLAAHDFGFLAVGELVERTRLTLTTMGTMERFRGHFFNWYDTQTLKPLHPLYVSTVDSGNLAGHLLTMETGLNSLVEEPMLRKSAWEAVVDTIDILAEDVQKGAADGTRPVVDAEAMNRWQRRLDELRTASSRTPKSLRAAWDLAHHLESELQVLGRDQTVLNDGARDWLVALTYQVKTALVAPLEAFFPWIGKLPLATATALGWLSGEGTFGPGDLPSLQFVVDHATAPLESWLRGGPLPDAAAVNRDELQVLLKVAAQRASQEIAKLRSLAEQCALFAHFDYDFLYDTNRHLMTIGYNVSDHRRDSGFYDLLASEARLASFVGIASGELPQEHWFALGRLLTSHKSESALLSWSGSMFEYLMPLLVMPTFKGTLLDQTYQAVVARGIEYGAQSNVPWGVSESGYNATDRQQNYQYKAFGVPGLGLRRGLAEELVVAPYASVMALMVAPVEACTNLQRLRHQGFEGHYGFYEAIDYTPSRLPAGQPHVVIRSFMAHHEGMSLLSLAYELLGQPMQRRFRSRSSFVSAELLLHERVPKVATFYPHALEVSEGPQLAPSQDGAPRVIFTPQTPRPEVHLLSNGRYSVMVTNSGGGYSRWQGLALTRWREDPVADNWGSFCYVRDVGSGDYWSVAHQPTRVEADHYEAIFPHARVEFRRRDQELDIHTEIAVSPEDDIELRRFTITNLSSRPRTIELTTYAEVALAPQAADETHPAFSNLFVQTEILPEARAILCTRRPRTDHEQTPVLLHLLSVHAPEAGEPSYETDRRQFLGRGHGVATPEVMTEGGRERLSGRDGSVLDPVVAMRWRVEIAPEQVITAHAVMGIGATREAALALAAKYHDRHLADRVFELAWTHRQVEMRHLQVSESEAQLYLRLASSVIFSGPVHRAAASILAKNRRDQSSLWGYGLSGDLPIVLLRMSSTEHASLVAQVIRAHSFWRQLGLAVDLVIWNEDDTGYRQELQELLMGTVASSNASSLLDAPGGIFIRRLEQLGEDDRVLMQTVARVVLVDTAGPLVEQVDRKLRLPPPIPTLVPTVPRLDSRAEAGRLPRAERGSSDLRFDNGFGGFSADGREYVIRSTPGKPTPAPWVNVMANAHFGSVVSERGSAYTWCENAHEFRLSPWANDPLTDQSGEAFYLRDEESGAVWSPMPWPISGAGEYETRHGFGYSTFKHESQGIHSEVVVAVAIDAPVKVIYLKIANRTRRRRILSTTGYCEWVLGELRSKTAPHILTEIDPTNGAVLARNPYHQDFGSRVGFLDVSEGVRSVTGDRSEFVGRNGDLSAPQGLRKERLSGRVGAALDPCTAVQSRLELAPGEERTISFVLGVGRDIDDARTLIRRFGKPHLALAAVEEVQAHWQRVLGGVQVTTPEPETDLLMNGWLQYQVISCRLWGRSGYYQSGGAFGFRDQLQDALSLIHTAPRLLREQIIRCASRQYREGDVQHWWHPPMGRGVRTHFSDDYLWLPLAVATYVTSLGDTGVLDTSVNFLEGRQVKPDEEAYGDLPRKSDETATVYEHCVRSIQHGLRFGVHGLPLMGCGDWNDGMNLVGERGKGESVWLAFFLYDVLSKFAPVAMQYGDKPFAQTCQAEAEALRQRIEANAWDGAWYRRAYFDGGEPLGSATQSECQIDSLPQSWAVLSGGGDPERSRQALGCVDQRLVDRTNRLIKLFDPPFDHAQPNPGYIQGYVPGVRENGGQYTHAAIWVAMAFAALGDSEKAWELARMINPLSHTATSAAVDKYMVEPYVVAADVYAVSPHQGRGGWTWYTGSAGWVYRLLSESLLGLSLQVDKLVCKPCVPVSWDGYKVNYQFRSTAYELRFKAIRDPGEAARVVCEGHTELGSTVRLLDDQKPRIVEIYYQPARAALIKA